MLSQANSSVPDTFRKFKDRGLLVGFLVPTETGMSKSIMDAHESLRRYLKAQGAHDFEQQMQGTENEKTKAPSCWQMEKLLRRKLPCIDLTRNQVILEFGCMG